MSNRNKHGGGNQTNINGLAFEEKISLNKYLSKIEGIKVKEDGEVWFDGDLYGQILSKNKLYIWFQEEFGADVAAGLSKKLLPDNAFYNIKQEKLYIIEVKYQSSEGSVDEKLQTFQFKKAQYRKMMKTVESQTGINIDVEYIYVLNDWFQQDKYQDVLEYIRSNGSHYYFDAIPPNKLGIY